MDALEYKKMEAYYADMPREGFCGRCEMYLPDDLSGKRVVDLLCRNGKGAYKIADEVGADGFVLGIDFDAACIARACAAAAKNHARGSEWQQTLSFAQGFPEDMKRAGLKDASFDVVFVNSALNLAWDAPSALREIARVLVPGGLLYHAGLFADEPLDASDAQSFAARGNVFGAAHSIAAFEQMVYQAGFSCCSHHEQSLVVPSGSDAHEALNGKTFRFILVSAIK